MTRVALYARVSTTDQHPEVQLDALRAYAEARNLDVAEMYTDVGVSGARSKRPALDRLRADAMRRRFDIVAVVKLDRLARSVHHLTTLGKEFEALGVDLVVLDQQLDTSTPSGKLLFHVLGSIAEFERDLIRDRTRAGLDAARRRGAVLGRPRTISGEASKRVARMHGAGRSMSQIAGVLGVSKAAVCREIQRARA